MLLTLGKQIKFTYPSSYFICPVCHYFVVVYATSLLMPVHVICFQSVQENEDDSAEISNAAEISELLGDKEHLYPKILYLVIADSAYSEGL